MKFRRSLLALLASAMTSIITVQIVMHIFSGQSVFEIELNPMFFFAWAIFDSVPILCWLTVLVPLLFFTRFFDRWAWYWSGLFGLLIGAAGAIAYRVLTLLLGSHLWKSDVIIMWGLNVAIQFIVVSLTKRWGKAAAPISEQTKP